MQLGSGVLESLGSDMALGFADLQDFGYRF